MKDMKSEEVFIQAVFRINRYFIMIGVFFLIYFLLKPKVDTTLLLLALSYMVFALLSHKHVVITDRLFVELQRSKTALADVSREVRDMHPE
jgi:hypothetical protein